jgi:D-xylose 1-dehydrogenase (NADP+, D-xylono-1,5-lactone-forming)
LTLQLALLSTAGINRKLIAGARDVDEVELVAVGSRDRARAEAQAAEFGIERAHGSYEAVLEDPEVEAVYIPLPNSLHVDWSVRALEAGKHVLCEKPLSRHPEEVERAFDAAEHAGRLLTEAFMWRHHPQARRLVELFPRVGELKLVRSSFSFPLADPGDVRLSRELEGGALMDVGCYCVSGSRLVAGEPVEVSAIEVEGGDGVDARMGAVLRFENDVLGHFDCALDCANRHELEVVGWDGTLVLHDPWHSLEPVIEVRAADGSVERVEAERENPYACELRDLAAAVAGERQPLLGREDALGQARTISALYESAATGRPVALSA